MKFIESHKDAIRSSMNDQSTPDVKLFVSANFFRGGYFSPQDMLSSRLVSMPGHCSVIKKDMYIKLGGCNTFLGPESDWFLFMSIATTYGFYAIPRWLSGVQPKRIRAEERGTFASNYTATSENSYIISEIMRILREEPAYKSSSKWMRLLCMDRFCHSSSWLRIIVNEILDDFGMNISNKLSPECYMTELINPLMDERKSGPDIVDDPNMLNTYATIKSDDEYQYLMPE